MKRFGIYISRVGIFLLLLGLSNTASAWHDETHLAVAKAAGYAKWYNATGADIAKVKAGEVERKNHYVNNPSGTVVTAKMVLNQVRKYNDPNDEKGHLYGAIVSSLRNYLVEKKEGKYGEYHLAYCAHYVGDLSMPLHNTLYDSFNEKHHGTIDGTVNNEVLEHTDKIKIYPIEIKSEDDLIRQIARIANISIKLGYLLESEDRLLNKEEAYAQLSHSASLLNAILDYAKD